MCCVTRRRLGLLLWGVCCAANLAHAADITLLATLDDKAIFLLQGERRTLRVGEETPVLRLIAITDDGVIIESDGRQRRLGLGKGYVAASSATGGDDGARLILSPDEQGHYFADIAVNGHRERGLVDTGATHLSMSRATASSMGIDYSKGKRGLTDTATGTIGVWLVKVPKLQLGTTTVYDVDVVVTDVRNATPLLIGSSLLNRFQMSRDQGLMILSKKGY